MLTVGDTSYDSVAAFSLCIRKEKVEFHGDDEEYKTKMQGEKDVNDLKTVMITALGLSITIIGLMIAALFL